MTDFNFKKTAPATIELSTHAGSQVTIYVDKIVALRACIVATEGDGSVVTTSDGNSYTVHENISDILAQLGIA